jgi:hypothetical protein
MPVACLSPIFYHHTVLMAFFLRDELSMEEERRKALRLFGIDGTVFSYKYTSPGANQILVRNISAVCLFIFLGCILKYFLFKNVLK